MNDYKKTKSVKLLIDAFGQSSTAMSVVQLVDKFHSKMNRTTVYRILDRLEAHGTLHSFTGKDGLKWYAKCVETSANNLHDTHPHFQCQACGKSECLPMDLSVPSIPNYKVDSAYLLLTGVCQDCIS